MAGETYRKRILMPPFTIHFIIWVALYFPDLQSHDFFFHLLGFFMLELQMPQSNVVCIQWAYKLPSPTCTYLCIDPNVSERIWVTSAATFWSWTRGILTEKGAKTHAALHDKFWQLGTLLAIIQRNHKRQCLLSYVVFVVYSTVVLILLFNLF